MNTHDDVLDRLWHSLSNQATAGELDAARDALGRRLRRRSRLFASVMTLAGLLLASMAAGLILRPIGDDDAVLAILLAPAGLALVLFVRAEWRFRRGHGSSELSIRQGLLAHLERNRLARRRLGTMAVLHTLSLPLWALGVQQLQESGRVAEAQVPSLIAVFAVLLGATALGFVIHLVRHLRPEKENLEALLRSYVAE